MKKNKILIGLLLCSVQLVAQKNFREAYIITANGDTVWGSADYQSSVKLTQKCRFQSKVDNKIKDYYPVDLLEFSFVKENRRFVKKTIKDQLEATDYFLEILVSGEMNLYDSQRKRGLMSPFFIQRKGESKLVNLPFSSQQLYVDDGYNKKLMTVNSSYHIDSLKKYMNDIPSIYPDIEDLSYLEREKLVKLIGRYNHLYAGDDNLETNAALGEFDKNQPFKNLVIGKLNLYMQTDADSKKYFYLQKANESQLIKIPFSKKANKYQDGLVIENKVNYSTNHIDTLKKYMADAPALFADIDAIEVPAISNLTRLVKEYNSYTDEKSYAAKHNIKRLPINLYVTPGLFFTSYKEYANFWGSNISLGFVNSNEHLFFKTGVFVSFYRSYEASSVNNEFLTLKMFKVPLLLEYRFAEKFIQPRIAVGCNFYRGASTKQREVVYPQLPMNVSVFQPTVSAGLSLKVSNRISLTLMPEVEFLLKKDNAIMPERYNMFNLFTGLQIKL